MPESGDISEDRGFKALFTSYPHETIEVFVPEVLTERGRPATVEAIQQESARPDLGEPNRFLDVALLATWADGQQTVNLLVEHWSETRKVDLRRVNWYMADFALMRTGRSDLGRFQVAAEWGAARPSSTVRSPFELDHAAIVVALVGIVIPADCLRVEERIHQGDQPSCIGWPLRAEKRCLPRPAAINPDFQPGRCAARPNATAALRRPA